MVKKVLTHTHIIIIVVAVLALVLSIVSLATKQNKIGTGKDQTYRLYVGLTDSDKNYQTIDLKVAKEIVKTVCIAKNVTYTVYEAEGSFRDDDNTLHLEKSLVLEMDHIDDKKLNEVAKEVCVRLNSKKAMIVKSPIEVYYFDSTK